VETQLGGNLAGRSSMGGIPVGKSSMRGIPVGRSSMGGIPVGKGSMGGIPVGRSFVGGIPERLEGFLKGLFTVLYLWRIYIALVRRSSVGRIPSGVPLEEFQAGGIQDGRKSS